LAVLIDFKVDKSRAKSYFLTAFIFNIKQTKLLNFFVLKIKSNKLAVRLL